MLLLLFVAIFILCCIADEVHTIRKILERNDK
ncbi:hypothetical protein ACVWWD_004241 [Mesorhizobium sp. URHB0026]